MTVLKILLADFQQGKLEKAKFRCAKKGVLSKKLLTEYIEERFGVTMSFPRVDNYELYSQIKLIVEGVERQPISVLEEKYDDLLKELREVISLHQIEFAVDLFKAAPELYKRVSALPESGLLYSLSGMTTDRAGYFYMHEDDVLSEASKFQRLVELKEKSPSLHKEIKFRNLSNKLLVRAPHMAGIFYKGLRDRFYRSQAELVMGNLLILNGVAFDSEVRLPIKARRSTKPMIADFLIKPFSVYVEIEQNTAGDRSDRRANYKKRNLRKREAYEKHGYKVLWIDSDPYYTHKSFDIEGFMEAAVESLREIGVELSTFPVKEVFYQEDEIKNNLLTLNKEQLLPYLYALGITGIAVLQNKFCSMHTMLSLREDYEQVMGAIKFASTAGKSKKQTARFLKEREQYASIEIVRKLTVEKNFKSQKQWFQYAKENKDILAQKRIPSSLQSVYKQLGVWQGWRSMWADRD